MMYFYPTLITIHIIFAGIWLFDFISGMVLRRKINANRGKSGEKKLILIFMNFTNLYGMIGSAGILITGIIMVVLNPGYGFFQMSANHWLATKQIIMAAILLIIFLKVIPLSKKIKKEIGSELEKPERLSDEGYVALGKLFKLSNVINILVIINFLFAITHRFLS